MKRLHVHIAVDDLDRAIGFYSTLFAAEPTVRKPDYAKWMLEAPKVNLAISQRSGRPAGIDHLGIQVDTDDQLRALAERLKSAGEATRDHEATTCCYAQSNKSWVSDPSGVRWETFFTFGEATTYDEADGRPGFLAGAARVLTDCCESLGVCRSVGICDSVGCCQDSA